jgi:glycerophosphoryl diester phosphodiesterase
MTRWSAFRDDIGRTLVIAHRGASALARENSKSSIEVALQVRADAIETDVRLTADGMPVCFHDADLTRHAGDPRRVEDVELAELKNVVPGLLTLRNAMVHSRNCGLLLDVKLSPKQHVEEILSTVRRDHSPERFLIGLRHLGHCERARAAGFPILAFAAGPDDVMQWAERGASWFRLWQPHVTRSRLDTIRRLGLRCAVMAGDPSGAGNGIGSMTPSDAAAILAEKPDAIIVDDPRPYI